MPERISTGAHGMDTQDLPPMSHEEASNIVHLDGYNAQRFVASYLNSLPTIETITPEAAKILCTCANYDTLELRFRKLDNETLKNLVMESNAEPIYDWYFHIAEIGGAENAKLLSLFKGSEIFFSLESITLEEAQKIAEYGTHPDNTNATLLMNTRDTSNLSIEVLQALMEFKGKLILKFQTLTLPQIKILKNKKGNRVYLEHLEESSIEALRELRYGGQMYNDRSIFINGNIVIKDVDTLPVKIYDALTNPNTRLDDVSIKESIDGLPEHAKGQITAWVPFFREFPHFKDLVYEGSQALQQNLKKAGINNPEAFYNLNAGADITAIQNKLFELCAHVPDYLSVDSFYKRFKKMSGVEFNDTKEFATIYLDEIVQAMADHLYEVSSWIQQSKVDDVEQRIQLLENKLLNDNLKSRPKRQLQQSLEALKKKQASAESNRKTDKDIVKKDVDRLMEDFKDLIYVKPNEGGFRLASRNISELTLGDECSDCTSASISGINFWTVPTWLTDPGDTFLLQYDSEGNLAHKFLIVLQISPDGTPLLTVDSMELANSQKDKAGMYNSPKDAVKEKTLLDEAISFLRNWADTIGIGSTNVYATQVSNTGTDYIPTQYRTKEISVSKLRGLQDVQRVLHIAEERSGTEFDIAPKTYLQSYKTTSAEDREIIDETVIFQHVEHTLRLAIEDFTHNDSPDLSKLDNILAEARKDPKKAAKKMNIFLIMEASETTKKLLSYNGKRIDVYLHNNNLDFERFFSSTMTEITILKGNDYIKAELYHLGLQKE